VKKLVIALLVAAAIFAALAVPALARNTNAGLSNRGLSNLGRIVSVNCHATAANVNQDDVFVDCD
jgi:hypothetical protein